MRKPALRLLAACGLLLLAACQGLPGERTAARNQREIAAELLRMEVRIGEERNSLSNFTLSGFSAINDMSLVVTAGVHDHYLITLVGPCLDLPYAFTIGFERRSVNITTFDSILVNTLHRRMQRCRIDKIFHLEDVASDADD